MRVREMLLSILMNFSFCFLEIFMFFFCVVLFFFLEISLDGELSAFGSWGGGHTLGCRNRLCLV